MDAIDIFTLVLYVFLATVATLIIPVACLLAARRKNRNRAGWFFLGFLGIIPLLVLTFLPPLDGYESEGRWQ